MVAPLVAAGAANVLGGLFNLAGSKYSTDAQTKIAEWQNANEQRKLEIERDLGQQGIDINKAVQEEAERFGKARTTAYGDVMGRAGTAAAEGEAGLTAATSQPLPELEQAKKDLLEGQSEALSKGTSQLGANLAMQGVRGGQAATLLGRGTGEITQGAMKDINQMALSDAEQRRAATIAYQQQKALTGVAGGLKTL